ncbi:MAG TPA: EamA family transporter [Methylomirabilota bacterium]|nr:EamA family transporter [Methylomirabilota bacterium]
MLTRNREATGFLLSVAFVCLAAARDVYFGALFQRVHPLAVALTAFTLCTLLFLPIALVRDQAGLARLRRRAGTLVAINATTAIAWTSFFHALQIGEPALVQVIFFGIGPLSVAWIDRLVPGTAMAARSPAERRLHLGLLAALLFAAVVMLGGWSGVGTQPLGRALGGLALTVGGGLCISTSTLLSRVVNDAGVGPATLIALRFPGAVALAGVLAALSPASVSAGLTPGMLALIALASLLLIVLPNYVNQIGIALASPLTVRAVLALGPVLVFLLQLGEGRLPSSAATLAACVLYAVFAVASAVARRRVIGVAPAAVLATVAGR